MALSTTHRRLLQAQALGGLVLNIPLNGAAAWLGFPPVDRLPLWAKANCVAFDTLGTSFFLPLITCLVLTLLQRRSLRVGALEPLPRASLPGFLRFWPQNVVGRGALVGLLSMLTVGTATLALLTAAGVESMSRGENVLYKAIYTALLGMIVTPLFGWRGLADVEAPRPR
ncbi:MAG: hypothetical protein ABI193_02065 [Minicystis sp.]